LFKNEGLGILGLTFFLSFAVFGKRRNKFLASSWLTSQLDFLKTQFAIIRTSPHFNQGEADVERLYQDGPNKFWAYATGRRGVRGGATFKLTLTPRGDLIKLACGLVQGLIDVNHRSEDNTIELEIPIVANANTEFIFGICKKSIMTDLRSKRWDIATFAPSSDNQRVPDDFFVFTEVNQVTEVILNPQHRIGFAEIFDNPSAKDLLISLIISDLSEFKVEPKDEDLLTPNPLTTDRRLTLTMKFPATKHSTDTIPLLILALNLIDLLSAGKPAMPEGVHPKIRKRRAVIVEGLTKEARAEQRDRVTEANRERKKKEEEERRAKLSPEKLRKEEELERKRAAKKQMRTIRTR